MTYLEILNIIKQTALAQPNINTVVREFLDLNREDTKYSAVVIQDRDGQRDLINNQDFITYTWHLGYVDRLLDDESNRDEIYSTGMVVLNNIVNTVRNTFFPDIDIEVTDRFNTFNQRFTASCAGVYIVIAVSVPMSECSDYDKDIFEKIYRKIEDNGHYVYTPRGLAFDEVVVDVSVPTEAKPEEFLQETIYTNGRYNFSPTEGRVFSEADITVDCPEPKEEVHLIESITENGEVHFTPESGKVYDWAEIDVNVHPSERFETAIYQNGSIFNSDDWAGVEIYVDVHPSVSLSETYTSNGSYNISGEYNGGVVTVAIPEQVGSFEVSDWGTTEIFYPDPGYVFSAVEILNATPTRSYTSTVTSNGSLRWSADDGGSLVSSIDISVDVHPSQSLIESITSNGSYHYSGEYDGADITVSVPVPVMSTLTESITSNGSYAYTAPSGQAYNSVLFDVSVPGKPESICDEIIEENGSYHFTPVSGEVFSGVHITTNVHPSASLVRNITANGSYSYPGDWNGAEITVSVSGSKPEETLTETITSNGSYHYDPTPGSVFSGADISVNVHPNQRLVETIATNGPHTFTGEWSGADISVDVHPSVSYSGVFVSNGVTSISGEFNGGSVTVDVHPSVSLSETITSNGSYHYTGEWKDADITVAVSAAKPEETLAETITSNGSYSYSPTPGSVFSGAEISVDVHPSASLIQSISSNGVTTLSGEWSGAEITVSVPVPVMSTLTESITSNGSYSYTAPSGQAYSSVTVAVSVPSTTNTVTLTQSQYNDLSVVDPNTIYLIYG